MFAAIPLLYNARYSIREPPQIGFASLIALEQLQIAPALITVLFTAIVGAVAIAFGLAFGLGGQDTARRLLARSENAVGDAAFRLQDQQTMNQRNQGYATPTTTNTQMQPDQVGTQQTSNKQYRQ